MADLDFKQIGLAAKDIVLGIGAAAAGSTGGPKAAEGVGKVGSGLDRILDMAGVAETRGDKFDRADFAVKPQPVATPQAPPTEAIKPAVAPNPEPVPTRAENEGPVLGDAKITMDHLRSLGWSRDKIQQILRGPEYTSIAALFGKETKGFRAAGGEGTRVAQVDAEVVPAVAARVVTAVDGQSVPTVRGAAVKLDTGVRRT